MCAVRAVLAAGLFTMGGCVVKKPVAPPVVEAPALTVADFNDLPGWHDDSVRELMPALRLQCHKLALLPPDTQLGGGSLAAAYGGRAGQWADPCKAALGLAPDADPHEFFVHWFAPYAVAAPALVTGYFEPVLRGSLTKVGVFQTPVYGRPSDLVAGPARDAQGRPVMGRVVGGVTKPYWTRAEIEAGSLQGVAKPLAWLANPADLFFAQIQGSAVLQLPDGGTLRLAFDARNGRPYTPIGRVLTAQGAIPAGQVSMQTIRAWLDAHSEQAKSVMDRNESYVFFRLAAESDTSLGPSGALGVALTAGRSAAVDKSFVPLATPLFVDSTVPDGRPWRHLVLAQDLGTAIAGAGRVDIFLGAGDAAAEWAGHMHQPGKMWLLLPRSVAARATVAEK